MTSEVSTEAVTAVNCAGEVTDSDDFGSFSDASFEAENDGDDDDVTRYLDVIFPDPSCSSHEMTSQVPMGLEELIRDERPHVIYEQLVQLRTALQPFNWKKSHLRSNLWHILRISEEENDEGEAGRQRGRDNPLDDSMYSQIRRLLDENNVHTNFLLKDCFKLTYDAPLTPLILQAEEEREQERQIPSILSKRLESVCDLRSYHDSICHAIDVLFVELQELNKRQSSLVNDKVTFENVVTNLTGHTQRLYRDEIALYNKKIKRKSKFGWGH